MPSRELEDGPVYTVQDVFTALVGHRHLVLGIAIFVTALVSVYAWVASPVYRSEVLAIPVEREGSAGGLSQLAGKFGGIATLSGIDLSNDSGRDETLAILQSNEFLSRFIREKNLIPVLFQDRWDEKSQDWRDPTEVPTINEAVRIFSTRVMSVVEEDGNLVRIRVDWYDPALAAEWANDLVARLNDTMRELARARAARSIEYLNKELEKQAIVEVREAVNRLLESQVKSAMIASVNEDYSLRVIDPAVPADRDRFIRPQRLLLLVAGILAGFSLGVVAAVVASARSRKS